VPPPDSDKHLPTKIASIAARAEPNGWRVTLTSGAVVEVGNTSELRVFRLFQIAYLIQHGAVLPRIARRVWKMEADAALRAAGFHQSPCELYELGAR
jgi:hypothetical protein